MAEINVYFATNRNHLSDNKRAVFGGRFNPDGVAALRFGRATFRAGDDGPVMTGITVFDETMAGAPAGGFTKTGSAQLMDALHGRMAKGRVDTLVYIHGFNVTFLEALTDGARIAVTLPQDVNIMVFSWPSDGEAVPFMSYYSDREDARASGPALARTYLKLLDYVCELPADDYCLRNLHILAHSMGNYVLRQGIQALHAKQPTRMVRLFDQVLMIAADEDDDAFERDDKLRMLPSLSRRITLYHNRFDRALLVSDKTKANPDRLGSDGPRMLDLLPAKVKIVDASKVAGMADRLVMHSYHVRSASVAADVAAVLAGEEDARIGNRETIRPERAYRLMA
ncbi:MULTISPECIES: alpha/beta hydrolase [unclassified Sphingomonas]|jgi:esterase/lipase superfamily enzyme|uniref:alpha/beta hydrolase n=1 Tax=unclassified Sphingomonas TaxID=196159 RepID=UPI00083126A5|nr:MULTISPECIES: alpha/beta hydrolase [unclassified Sphingomonas]